MISLSEQENRKKHSIEILKKQDVPYINHLPVIESERETQLRSEEEVCYRAICLSLVAAYAEGLEKSRLESVIGDWELYEYFTDEEKAFIALDSFDDRIKAKFIWRYESLWVLLWSLSYVRKLNKPEGICDVSFAVGTIVKRGKSKFIKEAKLRSKKEILDEADLIYRYHWATTEARIKGQPMPSNLENSTIYERHYALNWLIRYQDQEWDKISTDT